MYIVINSNNKIISSANYAINEEDCASRGERVQYIDNLKYVPEMVGSLFIDSDPFYIPAPSPFHEIVNNAWVYTERSNAKCLEVVTGFRNKLLSATDWTLLPDSPLTDVEKADWIKIRQELRDIKSTTADPLSALASLETYALQILK